MPVATKGVKGVKAVKDSTGMKDIQRVDLLQMYYHLRLTRALEERVTALYRQGRIVGGVYTSHGMEAISVGYASVLERDDVIAPFHRDMGAFLVRGIHADLDLRS